MIGIYHMENELFIEHNNMKLTFIGKISSTLDVRCDTYQQYCCCCRWFWKQYCCCCHCLCPLPSCLHCWCHHCLCVHCSLPTTLAAAFLLLSLFLLGVLLPACASPSALAPKLVKKGGTSGTSGTWDWVVATATIIDWCSWCLFNEMEGEFDDGNNVPKRWNMIIGINIDRNRSP